MHKRFRRKDGFRLWTECFFSLGTQDALLLLGLGLSLVRIAEEAVRLEWDVPHLHYFEF